MLLKMDHRTENGFSSAKSEIKAKKDIPFKKPQTLSPSELDGLRVILDGEKIDISKLDGHKANQAIEAVLEKYCLCVNADTVFSQYQNYTCTDQPTVKGSIQLLLQDPKFALHTAAKKGILPVVKMLVETGYDVNSVDSFGSTPLHVAALYGNVDVVSYLILQGSNVNAIAYKQYEEDFGYTPLDLAFKYAPNAETVNVIAKAGGLSSDWNHLNYIVWEALEPLLLEHSPSHYTEFDLILSKWEALARENPAGLWFLDGKDSVPVSLILQAILPLMTDETYYYRLQSAITNLEKLDSQDYASYYLMGINLLHSFPTDHNYDFKLFQIDGEYVQIKGEGHLSMHFTTDLAYRSLSNYSLQLTDQTDFAGFLSLKVKFPASEELILQNVQEYMDYKSLVFSNVTEIFHAAVDTAQKAGLAQTSETLFAQFNAGHTILIPTGWEGHGFDIIIDKPRQLFMVANAGDRYAELPPGVNAYYFKQDISKEDIYKILNNEEKINLELKYFYDLELVPAEEYSFVMEEQEFGNCAWNSQKIAEKALLFLELDKYVAETAVAKELSQIWYEQINDYHLNSILNEYMADPFLENKALEHILINYAMNVTDENKAINVDLIKTFLHDHMVEELPGGIQTDEYSPSSLANETDVLELNDILQVPGEDNLLPELFFDALPPAENIPIGQSAPIMVPPVIAVELGATELVVIV